MNINKINDIEVNDFVELNPAIGVTIKKNVSREVLENVCVTALEGGSNYWCHLSEGAKKKIRRVVPKNEDPYLSTAILKAVLDHNIEVPINDAEDEDEVLGYLSANTLTERMQKLCENEGSKWALMNELNGSGDADSSDVVFQWMVMGECIFG